MSANGDCIFCRIAAGDSPAHVVFENEQSLVILDVQPLAAGHCLAIPKRHVPWWHELTESETASLFEASRVVARKLMAELQPDFVCMYARGRRVPHTHIFLVPTWADDPLDRHFNSLEGFQEGAPNFVELGDQGALQAMAERLGATNDT